MERTERMEHLRCVVERITYQNSENGYSVIKCRAKGYQDLVTVVGSMPDVHVGSVLYLGGSWRIDGRYGRQFAMETFEETRPATVYGIEKYLGSGLVKGVGPKFAGRIVRQFGAETLNVIEENPDLLLEVPGIGKVRVERIKKSWMPPGSTRPTEMTASGSYRRIPTVLRMISGASVSGRRISSRKRWALTTRNTSACGAGSSIH